MAASYNEMSILINGVYLSACVIMQNWNSRFNKQGVGNVSIVSIF